MTITLKPKNVERWVVDQCYHEQRTRPPELTPTLDDVRQLSETALLVLQLFATGKSAGAVAEICGCHRLRIVRFQRWFFREYRFDVAEVRTLADATVDGIRRFVLSRGGAR